VPIGVRISLLILGLLGSRTLFAEQMTIDKQIRVSPEHRVMPYHITRVSDGDLIIFGSNNQVDYEAWATRVSPSGEVRWEYLQGGSNGWDDQSEKGQRYDSVIELPDHTTLLCGAKVDDHQRSMLLDLFSIDGTLIKEQVISPSWKGGSLEGADCIPWNDGIALIGAVSGRPSGTGWLAKIDWKLNVEWQKFGNEFVAAHIMRAPDSAFYYLNGALKDATGRSVMSLMRLASTDVPLALHTFESNVIPLFIYPDAPAYNLRFALTTGTLDPKVVDFDVQRRTSSSVIALYNTGVKKGLELQDGSIAIFGGQYRNGATAGVTRVYKDGSSKGFLVEPPYQSGWYYDAVLVDGKKQFAAVRLVDDGRAVLDWVSFK
jgi:hypothetical protein